MPRKSRSQALSDAEYRALAEFRYALRRFLAFSKSAAEAAGLTPRQHQSLLTIKGYPGRPRATVGELAERLQIRHHSAVGLVDRLTELGLVARRAGTRDRRETYVELTRRGEAKLRRLALAHRLELRKIAPVFATLVRRISDGE
jgi:DNA-binding MarR family transcriptional regulator